MKLGRLSFLIPLLLILSSLMGSALLFWQQINVANTSIRQAGVSNLHTTLTQLQNMLNTQLAADSLEDARLSLSVFALSPGIRTLLLADENNGVILANRYIWEGSPAAQVSAYDNPLAQGVRQNQASSASFEGSLLSGYYPVTLKIASGGLGVDRIGVLFVEYDLAPQLALARHNAVVQASLVGGLMMAVAIAVALMLHGLITLRMKRIVETSKRFAKGDLDARVNLLGHDELAELGRAFDEMAQQRKAAQEEVIQLNLRNRLILDATGEGIYGLGLDGRCTFANPAAAQLLGFNVDELLGQHSHDQFHHTHQDGRPYPEQECPIQAVYKLGLAYRGSDLYWRKNNGGFPVELVGTPILEAGQVTGAVVVFRDITERKQAEDVLKLNADRMDTLLRLNQMNDSSFEEITSFAFEAAVRLTRSKLGYLALMNEDETVMTMQLWSQEAMAECKVQGIPRIYPVETTGLWGEAVRQRRPIITNDYSAANPWKKGTPDGHVKLVRHMNLPIIVGGRIVLVVGVGNKDEDYRETDVQQLTLLMEGMWRLIERKRAEAELLRYKEQLEETVEQRTAELLLARDAAEAANKAKSVFLANMSHELRTPMNAILGFSNMMRRDSQLTENQRENLDIINRSGEHLLNLINDVLEVAKIEAGRLQLEIAPFDLGGMVRDVTDMMQIRAREKGLRLLLDQSSEFPRYIKGDEARIRQIIINLINNAVKFTDQGGVTVRLGVMNNGRQHLLIEVEDTGPGIAPEDQQRLFEPFVQLGEADAQHGTGLGLTITRQFVHMMGGTIAVESTLGKGAVFRVDLPFAPASEAEILGPEIRKPGDVTGVAPGTPRYGIMIVEDQLENRLLLSHLMTDLGFEVRVVENGQQCLELFQEWHPDLIWMDRRMPVMDGIEATKRLRQLPNGQAVKIVAVTASAFKEQQQEILDAGMDDFVRKPYRFNEIYDCISRQLHVEYRYSSDESFETNDSLSIDVAALTALPAMLREEFQEALDRLDSERIGQIIDRIADIDATLARALSKRADTFDYPAILDALKV